jgi:ankyrin repeat protein
MTCSRTKKYASDLLFAIETNNLKLVQECIASGVNVNTKTSHFVGSWTILMRAVTCRYARTDIIRELIANGAKVNERNLDGDTALILVCRSYTNRSIRTETIKILLENGADTSIVGDFRRNALSVASWNGYCDVVTLLFEHMTNIKILANDMIIIICKFCE